jgi:class 3 adenylate cyclase
MDSPSIRSPTGRAFDDESHISTSFDEGFDEKSISMIMTAEQKYARRETRFARCLQLTLLLLLLTLSAIASTVVYFVAANQEQAEFEEAFSEYSAKLNDEFQIIMDRSLGALAAFSTAVTATTIATNATWPFVTIPNYEAQVRHIADLASVDVIAFTPILETQKERNEWENLFVPQNINQWVHESIANQQLYEGYVDESMLSYEVKPFNNSTESNATNIYFTSITSNIGSRTASSSAGPYLPLWQIAPFVPGRSEVPINYDTNTDPTFNGNVIQILQQRRAALGSYIQEGYASYSIGSPTSAFYYPVLMNMPNNSTVGGALSTLFYWLQFFANILPSSGVGLIGVLGNSCNQTFTFRVDGAIATKVGDGDLHDPKYDYLKRQVTLSALLSDTIEKKEYFGFPIDETGCTYSLSIYPSDELQEKYTTNTPVTASLVVLLIFLVTSSLFIMYDRFLQRRQRLAQKQAESSGAIVSSLFPEAYRDRLMAAQNNKSSNTSKESPRNNFGAVSEESPQIKNGADGIGGESCTALGQVMADLYPECTVFFADIAGFTHWSATREPVQVFCLLQEIYSAMDKSAKNYNVFKVETIGDCYMAVTGLPNPQTNHALLMSRFALDCLIQMNETVTKLIDTLGEDTASLTLRIGLHSGPVTAGILRGEKSRFQLFGDTVNTASRMESTGQKGRIQVSTTTADKIRGSGKGRWLYQREDMVEAKGKGKMQTYWLTNDRASSISKDSTVEDYNGRMIDI